MDVLDKYFGVHGDALALRSKRLEMLASNIANAATPGFKARDIDFAAELKRAEGGGAGLQATSVAHIAEGTPGFGGDALYRIPVQSSLDGNTVELSGEQIGRDKAELQSLMRRSYAVFCLKKKTTTEK